MKTKLTSILLAVLAAFTGVALGYMYVGQIDPDIILAYTEADLREDNDYIESLYASSVIGGGYKTVNDFNKVENFLIAEYKFNHSVNAQKKQLGLLKVNAPVIGVVEQYLISYKTKIEDFYQTIQISKSSMAQVANMVNYYDDIQTLYSCTGDNIYLDTSIADPVTSLSADFSSNKLSETSLEQYVEESKTSPKTLLQFVISTKTVSSYNEKAKLNSDGYYELSFEGSSDGSTGANSQAMAVYYVYEIVKTGGSLVAGTPKYTGVNITYQITDTWDFVCSNATENYTIAVSIGGQKLNSSITSNFEEWFFYGDDVSSYPMV